MPVRTSASDSSQLAVWFEQSGAAAWDVSVADFAQRLDACVAHHFGDRLTDADERDRYLTSLHHRDVALAIACDAGTDRAWEVFVAEYRPILTRAADAIDPSGRARETADALFAELFGLRERDGARQSLFRYFHGRSSLATWLRAVLAQRVVDRVRIDRRTEPLPETGDAPVPDPRPAPDARRAPCMAVITRALATALAGLDARDRLRLGAYYVQHLTLAEIGRLLKEHEGSVSRHLTRIRAAIRLAMATHLRDVERMSEPAVSECLQSMMNDAGSLDLAELMRELAPAETRKNTPVHRSKD